jgi:hypothetical protein
MLPTPTGEGTIMAKYVLLIVGMLAGIQSSYAFGSSAPVTPPAPPEAYDETVNYAPPFSMNQNDSSLSDLFNPANGKSGLCVPTTLANIAAEQAVYRSPDFSNLKLVATPDSGNYGEQVRYFAQNCHTDPVNGTLVQNAATCMRQFYAQSGYQDGWVYLIGKDEALDPESVSFWHGPMTLTVDDIRYYLSKQVGVLMDIEWETQAPNWVAKGGHTFMLAGYDYDFSWGQDKILLKVVNPENTYAPNDPTNHYDEVTMTSAASTPGASFPPGFTYVLSGNGFGTGAVRGYVRNIMAFLPDRSVEPSQ